MKIKAIITGSTGMVGKGILLECLENPNVESVLVINRNPIGIKHEKLKEIIHKDFYNLDSIKSKLEGYNACYFSLGISSVGMSEEDYIKITYDLTMNFAKNLLEKNKDLTFCFVSGAGTDSSEKGKIMWARVKGKAENAILKMPFKNSYAFRPAYIQPIGEVKSKTGLYNFGIQVAKHLYPILKVIFPNHTTTSQAIGKAMINVVQKGYENRVIESKDINILANEG